MTRIVSILGVLLVATMARADDELFEKKIRPLLAEHCYACHSQSAKKLKAHLLVDSRDGLLKGGDTGPAIVPGAPEKSLLVTAISYADVDLTMPPRGKLPESAIADLTTWIKDGAKWPAGDAKKTASAGFDLAKRKADHWAWRPIRVPAIPNEAGADPIDRFLAVKMREQGLTAAPPASPHALLRRLSFDLVGLPPTPEQLAAFEKACGNGAPSRAVVEKVVDELLASPAFSERWARHWLDLVRYAESRGHEFDYTLPDAYQYRDYVIRALDADVPYDRFVLEHLAGDLLPDARLDPTKKFDESILGTGFWWLGEQLHSPVDICQDKADRFDNMIDVMSKTFLGLTVACARCHDHKFDAISTKDYYALFGFLDSSTYRLVPFDTRTEHAELAREIEAVRRHFATAVGARWKCDAAAAAKKLAKKLVAAGRSDVAGDPLDQWVAASRDAAALKKLAESVAELRERLNTPPSAPDADVIVDYAACAPEQWRTDGVGFGSGPILAGAARIGDDGKILDFAEVAAAERDVTWDRVRVAPGTEKEPGGLGGPYRYNRTLLTPKFVVKDGVVHFRVRGAGQVFACVDGHIMLSGPLHGQTVQPIRAGDRFAWQSIDLTRYKGRLAHLEFTGIDGKELAVAAVRQSPPPTAKSATPDVADRLARPNPLATVAAEFTALCELALSGAAENPGEAARLMNWMRRHPELFPQSSPADEAVASFTKELADLRGRIRPTTHLAPAILDNVGVDDRVFIRGNPKSLGEPAPRRFLEALAGPAPLGGPTSSGRLELARQIVDPAVDPLLPRVIVNRLWHHLFGQGIVPSVDNFGVLGQPPSHPELLDHLADRFVKDGWSLKRMIRAIVLTDAYRRGSRAEPGVDKIDPTNICLAHQNLRRLEGEAIRDAMLAISGRLDPKRFGPAVPVHLTNFQEGRGRPASGPLDGEGRRSLYLAVRRNFASSFLAAFDTPTPFSTMGRRTVSNVPAQALILLNDPFVHLQADVWAKRVSKIDEAERIETMYLAAFSRPPTADELAACRHYVASGGSWSGLAHVLLNAKEFVFLE
jgi:Protein of unknown function (DUF1553)/Protein of unknown function (DUF1549)/Planctomycete cytochrome C